MGVKCRSATLADIEVIREITTASILKFATPVYGENVAQQWVIAQLKDPRLLLSRGEYFIAEMVAGPQPISDLANSFHSHTNQPVNTKCMPVGVGGWWPMMAGEADTPSGKLTTDKEPSDADQGGARNNVEPQVQGARVRAVFVHPEHSRKGVGAALMEAIEASAVANLRYKVSGGQLHLLLWSSKMAIAFYEAMGYVPQGTAVWKEEGIIEQECLIMTKRIPLHHPEASSG